MKGFRYRQSGFTLIELMIGLTIGLFILLGVVMVYVSSARSQATSESLARVQESGRFATYMMAREVRQAGYMGSCPGSVNNLLDTSSSHYVEAFFDLDSPIRGWTGSAGALSSHLSDYLRGDVLLITHAARSTNLKAKGATPANAASISFDGDATLAPQGSILLISDTYGCDLFQRANSGNGALARGAGTGGKQPGNVPPKTPWSHDYKDDMEINRLNAMVFYIGEGPGGEPALKQYLVDPALGGGKTPLGIDTVLVEGVEEMRLRFGIDADGDGAVDTGLDGFVAAKDVADWKQVVAVQIALLTISGGNVLAGVEQELYWPFDSNGNSTPDKVIAGDKSMRSVFTTTVSLRNRLP
ncbi:PilW family protein [Marinobacterium marinum]|uniref:PilW family protein n=1 Tax=Marinobacterium marinum TaxID=2756129 RepID=A0A7W2A9Z4_9GAMM|nr:PilW family protein [Marinobacterium marinum]MBA4501296.1 PilW family protein [Marinobacterium marinum]